MTFNNLDDLRTKVDQAYQCAQVASSPEPIELAEIPAVEKTITAPMKRDFRDVSLAEKKALAEHYNNILRSSSDKIIDTDLGVRGQLLPRHLCQLARHVHRG